MSRAIVILLVCTACGAYTRGAHLRDTDEVLRVTTETRPGAEQDVEIEQHDTDVEVRAFATCDRVERQEIVRTHVYRRKSKIGPVMLAVLVGAVAASVAGGLMLANIADYPDEDAPGVDPDELTAQDARLLGGLFTTLAGGLVLAASIHGVQLLIREGDEEQLVIDGNTLASSVPCEPALPLRNVPIIGQLGRERFELGLTETTGRAHLDLSVLDPSRIGTSGPTELELSINGRSEGVVDLAPLRAMYERQAWDASRRLRCAAPTEPDDCEGVERYLREHPHGAHAGEAHQLLRAAREPLARAAARREAEREAAAQRVQQAIAERELQLQRERAELERQQREAEAARRAAIEAQNRRIEQAQREAEAQRRREAARRECHATCYRSCGGSNACVQACFDAQCR